MAEASNNLANEKCVRPGKRSLAMPLGFACRFAGGAS